MANGTVVLLGPQRLAPTVNLAMESLGVRGRIGAVTAGWEEREGEDKELTEHLGGRVVNLAVWERGEEVYGRDPELLQAMRERRELLRRLQELYRLRLGQALAAARALGALASQRREDELLASEHAAAIEDVRRLDAEHAERIRRVHEEHERAWRPRERPAVAAQRAEIQAHLATCDALCIAGGNVRVLLGRLRLFDVLGAWGERPLVAWSGGAMVLARRVVLFHDSPPQGEGDAEVYEQGLGCIGGVVPLPHARTRLRLGDAARVALLARRFGPDRCVALDERSRADWSGGAWRGAAGTLELRSDGRLAELGAA